MLKAEPLKPTAEFAEIAPEGRAKIDARFIGQLVHKHASGKAGPGGEYHLLCEVVRGVRKDAELEATVQWAFETFGAEEMRLLVEEGGLPLAEAAQAKRRRQKNDDWSDPANAWLNAELARRQAERLDRQIEEIAEHAKRAPLALLVGAGASRPKPSEVPLYHELAWELTGEPYARCDEDPGACFDVACHSKGGRIYQEVADRIRTATEPNPIHHLAVRMLKTGAAASIVTTNWDTLLEAAAAKAGMEIGRWPREERGQGAGLRAEGVVHLHGVADRPDSMLVSKSDLDGHYEKESEARFAQEMLGDRSILCVGYSFRDIMIRKIHAAIAGKERARNQRRRTFSLVKRESDSPDWEGTIRALEGAGIEPVPYDRHGDVPEILERIAHAIERDAYAEQRRLEELGAAGARPDTSWGEVEDLLREGDARLTHFLRRARPEDWACEAFLQHGAGKLVGSDGTEKGARGFARWLCAGLDTRRIETILWLAAKSGQKAGGVLGEHLAGALAGNSGDLATGSLLKAGMFLAAQGRTARAPYRYGTGIPLSEVAARCSEAGRHELGIALWIEAIRVEAGAEEQRSDAPAAIARVRPRTPADEGFARQTYEIAVEPFLRSTCTEVWDACRRAIEDYQRILDATADATPFDDWSFMRPTIEEHEQDESRRDRTSHLIIDAARDALGAMARGSRTERSAWTTAVREASGVGSELLRRLAVHGVGSDERQGAARKLRWLARSGLIDDDGCRPEVYGLLLAQWKKAPAAERRLIEAKLSTGRIGRRKRRDRKRYDLLIELDRRRLGREAKRYLTALQERYPVWKPNPHARFRYYVETGPMFGTKPEGWTSAELVEAWRKSGSRALDEVIDDEGWRNWPPDAPNAEGCRDAVEAAARADREWGRALAGRLARRRNWTHEAWSALARALAARMDLEELLEWTRGVWWRRMAGGETWRALRPVAERLAKLLGEGDGTQAAIRTGIARLEEWASEGLRHEQGPRHGDWTNHCDNTTSGAAVYGLVCMAASGKSRPAHREAALNALSRLWEEGGIARKYTATLAGNVMAGFMANASDWTEKRLLTALDTDENPELRELLWNAVRYSPPLTLDQYRRLKAGMHGWMKTAPESKNAREWAQRYAASMAGDLLGKEARGRYEDWTIHDLPSKSRAEIVEAVAYAVWAELPDESRREMPWWSDLVKPLWEDVLEHSEEPVSPAEQRRFLHCFAFLDEDEQDEFRSLFVKGPAIAPERFLNPGYGPRGEPIRNRRAALEIAIHCAESYVEGDARTWEPASRTIRGWLEEGMEDSLTRLGRRVLAAIGS